MPMEFYSKTGEPVAYSEDDEHLYLFSGAPVGYIIEDAVYAFNGTHTRRDIPLPLAQRIRLPIEAQ